MRTTCSSPKRLRLSFGHRTFVLNIVAAFSVQLVFPQSFRQTELWASAPLRSAAKPFWTKSLRSAVIELRWKAEVLLTLRSCLQDREHVTHKVFSICLAEFYTERDHLTLSNLPVASCCSLEGPVLSLLNEWIICGFLCSKAQAIRTDKRKPAESLQCRSTTSITM